MADLGLVPASRLASVRVLVGTFSSAYLLLRFGEFLRMAHFPEQNFRPTGITALLEAPLPSALVTVLSLLTLVSSLLFTWGWRHRFHAPIFGLLLLWTMTYRSSFGMIFHTENLLCLHVLILALVPSADALAPGRRKLRAKGGYAWPLALMSTVTLLTYVLAGVAKLRISGADWLSGEVLRNNIAMDNLRKLLLGDTYSIIATPLLPYEWIFMIFALLTFVIELGAPVALLHRRVAWVWAIGAWGFHVGIVLLMAIVFPYPLTGVAFASLFDAEKLVVPALNFFKTKFL